MMTSCEDIPEIDDNWTFYELFNLCPAMVAQLQVVNIHDADTVHQAIYTLHAIKDGFEEFWHECGSDGFGWHDEEIAGIHAMFIQKLQRLEQTEGRDFGEARTMLDACTALATLMIKVMEQWWGWFPGWPMLRWSVSCGHGLAT
jgi:hypothetical protein